MMDQHDRDSLIELNTSFKNFLDDWHHVKRNGFTFCQTRQAEIDQARSMAVWCRNTLLALILIMMTATIGYIDSRADADQNKPASKTQQTQINK